MVALLLRDAVLIESEQFSATEYVSGGRFDAHDDLLWRLKFQKPTVGFCVEYVLFISSVLHLCFGFLCLNLPSSSLSARSFFRLSK